MKKFSSLFQNKVCIRLLYATSLAFFIFAASCQQAGPTTLVPATPTPQPSVTVVSPPVIRTSEVAIDFAEPLQMERQQDISFAKQGLAITAGHTSAQFISKPLAVTLEKPAPFLALSAKWASVITKDAKLTISLRASTDQQQWSEWQRSSLDGDPRTQAGLFFFPPDSKFVQYQIEAECDATQHSPLIQSLKLRFISPGATLPSALSQLNSDTFLHRAQWDCPDTKFPVKQQKARVQHLIVHHTATANDVQDWPAVVRTIWNFHAFTNGWRDLGYHYLIDPNGVVYQGHVGGDQAAGMHFSCANTGTMGIAMLGNFTSQAPTEKALKSLKDLLAQKARELRLDPTAVSYHPSTGLNLPEIAGHRDANASKVARVCAGTHCPGDALYALLPAIRAEVKAQLSRPDSLVRSFH
ncbi:MAG: N-acetylmuramoyl-L-alanine amidase [Acidobacteria bacterium]|nr:N-acetylmuramoyl-L-alanine amidase [Acidobacteriota bacterium]